jgi:hypothetical protein
MKGGPRHCRNIRSIEFGKPQADVLGVLQLLLSAKESVRHYADQTCAGLIERCISRLQRQHAISHFEPGARVDWPEASPSALLRLLEYARAELSDGLNDRLCGEQLTECIDRLMTIQQISREQLYEREMPSLH